MHELYARIREDSGYHGQDTGEPFPVTLNQHPRQLADGYYISGGPGGNYSPSDLDFYIKVGNTFKKIERTRRGECRNNL